MEKMVSGDELVGRIKQIVSDALGVDYKKLQRESKFVEDLGADSLDKMTLLLAVENELGRSVSDEEASRLTTINAVIELIESEGSRRE